MSVMEKPAVCTLPSEDGPGCGCHQKARARAKPDGKIAATAAVSGLAAAACASCCVLPFVLPAVLLANVGGVIALLDHAHAWVTRAAIAAVACAWCWVILQMIRTGRAPARSASIMMVLATVLTLMAASWPLIEPMAFRALGIARHHATPVNDGSR
jgi:hypothetical protein